MKTLFVLRPYYASIRTRVMETLRMLDFDVDHALVERRGTPDMAIIETLRQRAAPDGLLVPFHQQADERGMVTDGLALMSLIHRELPAYADTDVFMPVSQVAQAAFQLRLASQHGLPAHRLHVLRERDLDNPEKVAARLRATLRSKALGGNPGEGTTA
ncbi:MAG: hypothetical protein AB2A00_18495 [Myxococcota bacterium]